jgi:lactate dehydrogenase-like 2-hydroxyacid dehydrogenase
MDTRHLASMLAAGRIYGAGIDVFDVEPPEDDPVIATGHAASVFSPHVGWDTPDAMTDLYRVAVDNIIRFAQGAPANVVAVAPV